MIAYVFIMILSAVMGAVTAVMVDRLMQEGETDNDNDR